MRNIKKIVLFAIILLSGINVQAQIYVPDSQTLDEAILQSNDTIFANIDSNAIPTKILLNKCHIVDTGFVYAFGGDGGNYIAPELLRNKFNDFLHITARLATHSQSLTDFAERVDKSMEHSWKSDTLFLSVADINYNVFKNNTSLLSFSNNQYTVNAINQALLYDTKKFFCASPNKYYNIGNSFTLLLPDSLTFTNTLFTYNYFIDIGSGYQSFATNQSFTFSATADSMLVHFLAISNNNDSLFSNFWLYNTFPPLFQNTSENKSAAPPWECGFQYGVYTNYDFMKIVNNNWSLQNSNSEDRGKVDNSKYKERGRAHLYVKYSCKSNKKLTKPFVFVEGVSFDKPNTPEQTYETGSYFGQEHYNKYQVLKDLYEKNLQNIDVGFSTFNWATLVTGIDAEGLTSDPSNPLKVEKCPELLSKLCQAGYDIVFVDFESGQNFMENNGYALSKLLKIIKDTLDNNGSTEKLVVCGASMGGLVSRFAIRDLELNGDSNYNNCVSKFISFDAPQMGANINSLNHI